MVHFHACGKEILQFYHEAFHFGASGGNQVSFIAVEQTADDTDFTSAHLGRNFFRQIILGVVGGTDRKNETFHLSIRDCHRGTAAIAHEAVLQGLRPCDDGVKPLLFGMDEQQIPYYRDIFDNLFPVPGDYL